MKPKLKICIGMPNKGQIETQTAFSLISCSFYTMQIAKCSLYFYMPAGGIIDEIRNKAAQEALDTGSTHLMFIDSDMIFPDDGILRLLAQDRMIIGANYNLREMPLRCTVKIADTEGVIQEVFSDKIPKEPFKCYAVGTGFMLINVEVFKKMPKPWFFYTSGPEKTIGEDINFCKKARECGIDVWCDPTLEIGHIGGYIY